MSDDSFFEQEFEFNGRKIGVARVGKLYTNSAKFTEQLKGSRVDEIWLTNRGKPEYLFRKLNSKEKTGYQKYLEEDSLKKALKQRGYSNGEITQIIQKKKPD